MPKILRQSKLFKGQYLPVFNRGQLVSAVAGYWPVNSFFIL